jgi:hypothetical protein
MNTRSAGTLAAIFALALAGSGCGVAGVTRPSGGGNRQHRSGHEPIRTGGFTRLARHRPPSANASR